MVLGFIRSGSVHKEGRVVHKCRELYTGNIDLSTWVTEISLRQPSAWCYPGAILVLTCQGED